MANSFDYKIGVRLAMTSNAPEMLGLLMTKLSGVGSKVDLLKGKFEGLKLAIVGATAAFAGDKMLGALAGAVKYGDELVRQQQLLAIAGVTQQQLAQETAKAFAVSAQVQTAAAADVLQHIRELRYAFGSLDVANQYIAPVEKAEAVLKAINPKLSDQVWSLVKGGEMKNYTQNPAEFMTFLDDAVKVAEATGGKVTPQMVFQAFKYGRTAMLGWDEQFISGALPRLLQDWAGGGGGGKGGPGNALMSAFQNVVSGQITKKAAQEFDRLGLATSFKDITGSSSAQVDVVGKSLFQKNPYQWVQQILVPALAKAGYTTKDQQVQEIGRLFPSRTAGAIISQMATQDPQFQKDIGLQHQALANEAANAALRENNPSTVMAAFTAQWQSLMQALAAPSVPIAIAAMKKVTDVFTELGSVAAANPGAMKAIGEGLGALAIGLTAFGTIAVGAALVTIVGVPVALTAAAVGVAAALGALIAINWDTIKQHWQEITEIAKVLANVVGLGPLVTGVQALYAALNVDWKSAFGKVIQGLESLWDKLKGWFHILGPGEDKGMTPTSYETYGNAPSFNNGVYYPGGGAGASPGGGANPGGRSLYRNANPAARGPITTNAAAAVGQLPAAATSNAYIASQRAQFLSQLQDPTTRLMVMAMMKTEGMPVQDLESLLNRASFAHKSVRQMLQSGFYRNAMRHWPSALAEISRNPKLAAKLNSAIATVLGGSDTIRGHTDQGNLGLGDPGAAWEMRHSNVHFGKEVFGDWLQSRASADWREHFESAAHGAAASPAIPSRGGGDIHVHAHVDLDGERVADSTMKHIAGKANEPSRSGRLSDPFAHVPNNLWSGTI